MGLPVNNKNNAKLGGKGSKSAIGGASKFIAKASNNTKAVGAAKKPVKTGGSRGS